MIDDDGPHDRAAESGPNHRADAREAGAPLSVLLVEDAPEYARLVEEMLADETADREAGAELRVSSVSTLAAAATVLREAPPDCVLLDLSLPDAEGLDALAEAQALAPGVPIVVLSGHEDEALAVNAVHLGAQDYLVKRQADGPLLSRAVRYAIKRKEGESEIARQALSDPLTGLANRAALLGRLRHALGSRPPTAKPITVLFIDLDRFKEINDELGHSAGDAALVQVARRLVAATRPADTVARLGGDEFVVMVEDLGDGGSAHGVLERIRSVLSPPYLVAGTERTVEASIGMALGSSRSTEAEALIRTADRAMFDSKRRRRLRPRTTPTARPGERDASRAEDQAATHAELEVASERRQFRVEYQPQVDLVTRRVSGIEALLRWQHPARGLIDAREFVADAETSGLIIPIGSWVIEEACEQLAAWSKAGLCDERTPISVNISLRQLRDPRLPAVVAIALERSGIAPRRLCLEITEGAVVAEPAGIEAMRALGVALAVDDLGAGPSALLALSELPVDIVKVAREFSSVADLDLRSARLLGAVVGLGRALDLVVVVKGIERRAQLRCAADAGAHAGQGFLLGRPASPAALGSRLSTAPLGVG